MCTRPRPLQGPQHWLLAPLCPECPGSCVSHSAVSVNASLAHSSTHPCPHAASTAPPPGLTHPRQHLHDASLFPASCVPHCSSCGVSSLRLLHLSAGLSREAPHTCPESPISSLSTICLRWFQLQGVAYSLSAKGSLLSDMAMSEEITYFMYFKILVYIRMGIKFRVEFYLSF